MTPPTEPLPLNLYRAADVREMDRRAIEQHGLGDGALMERAGAAAFAVLREQWADADRIAVFAGPGNNGGDGYVVARLAHRHGLEVTVYASGEPKAGTDAARAWAAFRDAGGRVTGLDAADAIQADMVVDALMGTGIDRPLQGAIARAVEVINASGAPCLALDIASGLHADTGAVLGCAVRATFTITFIGIKSGLLTGRGPAFAGALRFAGLDVPDDVYAGLAPAAQRLAPAEVRAALAPRDRDAHKGRFGHILVVGGDHGMPGAVRMVAESALRVGAGLVSVFTRPEHIAAVVANRPELMCRGGNDATALGGLLDKASVVAIGPGLGQEAFGQRLFARVLASNLPLVVDADGLNLLAQNPVARGNWILTPHPGEAARLLGVQTADIQADRFAAARQLAERYRAAVVLKGAGSLVAAPGRIPALIDRGNPGMAAGGMGDALTGVVAGLRGQLGERTAFDAARFAAWVHATAGDRAAVRGERGLLAGDLIAELRAAANP